MTYRALFGKIAAFLDRREYGAKIRDREGELRDTGVEELKRDLITALSSLDAIDLESPLVFNNNTKSPGIIMVNTFDGNNALMQGFNSAWESSQIGVGLGSYGLLANEFIPDPAFFIDPSCAQQYYASVGNQGGTSTSTPGTSANVAGAPPGKGCIPSQNARDGCPSGYNTGIGGTGDPGCHTSPFAPVAGIGQMFVSQQPGEGTVDVVWQGQQIRWLTDYGYDVLLLPYPAHVAEDTLIDTVGISDAVTVQTIVMRSVSDNLGIQDPGVGGAGAGLATTVSRLVSDNLAIQDPTPTTGSGSISTTCCPGVKLPTTLTATFTTTNGDSNHEGLEITLTWDGSAWTGNNTTTLCEGLVGVGDMDLTLDCDGGWNFEVGMLTADCTLEWEMTGTEISATCSPLELVFEEGMGGDCEECGFATPNTKRWTITE